jgi:hypothetical protein
MSEQAGATGEGFATLSRNGTNSRNGCLEAIKRKKVWGSLNPQLHATAS